MSPRGLISILLFIQLKEVSFINTIQVPIDERVLLIVILSSMLIMLLGTMKKQKKEELVVSESKDDNESIPFDMPIEPQNLSQNENNNP
jgi:hypothetical protein